MPTSPCPLVQYPGAGAILNKRLETGTRTVLKYSATAACGPQTSRLRMGLLFEPRTQPAANWCGSASGFNDEFLHEIGASCGRVACRGGQVVSVINIELAVCRFRAGAPVLESVFFSMLSRNPSTVKRLNNPY